MLKRHLLFLVLAIAALFAVACEDSPEDGPAIFGVSDINDNQPVVVAGAATTVNMTFRWRPYFDLNGSIQEAEPHGDYVIEEFRITWTAVTPGATAPSPREEDLSIFIPVYDLVTAGINVVTADEAAAVGAGSVLNANVEFTAREMGTDRESNFAATFAVTFN